MTSDKRQVEDELIQLKGLTAANSHWRSLEELAGSPEFEELLHREFPEEIFDWKSEIGRRGFIKLMGASLALAGLTGCTRQPPEHIAPYVRQPEEIIPGHPLFFATAMTMGGFATGLLVESHEGRPTKVEGNPLHPASLGATDLYAQASVLGLYDPDRSQTLTYLGEIATWSSFLGALRSAVEAQRAIASSPANQNQQGQSGSNQPRGAAAAGAAPAAPTSTVGTSVGGASTGQVKPGGFRLLTETVTSPTLAHQINTLLASMPNARWHQYEPAGRDNTREGTRLAFGQYANAFYRFDKANVILSLDADFLSCEPAGVRYSRDFAEKRRLVDGKTELSRFYVVESAVTITGSSADHRLPLRPSEIEGFARVLATRLGVQLEIPRETASEEGNWISALVDDLNRHRGSSIVIAGESQPPAVHAIAHAINAALGNAGNTVIYTDPVESAPQDQGASLRELAQAMNEGRVDLLLILGGNPVYNAPADIEFAEGLKEVPLRIHLSLYKDETSELCHWHVPEAHYLESWGDARAFDGTISIAQPLIAPLYEGKSAYEIIAACLNNPEAKGYDLVRDYWKARFAGGGQEPPIKPVIGSATSPSAAAKPAEGFEEFWRKSLRDGLVADTALAPRTFALKSDWMHQLPRPAHAKRDSNFEIVFRTDSTIYDGRFANNGWLQELPKPIIRLTWDNAAIISPATAKSLGVGEIESGFVSNRIGRIGGEVLADRIEIDYQGRRVTAPVFIVPGQPDRCITINLGYGRTTAGKLGSGIGFNAYELRTSTEPWFGSGPRVTVLGGTYSLAATQLHHMLDTPDVKEREEDIVRSGGLEEFKKKLNGEGKKPHESRESTSLFPDYEYKGYAWGMSIDLNACTGCSACVVACQAENNIPVVGKEQVARSREMHWLRIDSYYKGAIDNPETYFQPVLCQQCENAPCEIVCPVAATAHSAEGLNDMVYNRCVGTRYCSNNCPYKVRRFNFLLYQDFYTASLKMLRNPDVSVRSRGVMEKCTYCVQRIQRAKIESEKENRTVRDGEIATACEAACPTRAIVFGNINDPQSRVTKLKQEERDYSLLGMLNTRPRTTYLAAVRNPNPELES